MLLSVFVLDKGTWKEESKNINYNYTSKNVVVYKLLELFLYMIIIYNVPSLISIRNIHTFYATPHEPSFAIWIDKMLWFYRHIPLTLIPVWQTNIPSNLWFARISDPSLWFIPLFMITITN